MSCRRTDMASLKQIHSAVVLAADTCGVRGRRRRAGDCAGWECRFPFAPRIATRFCWPTTRNRAVAAVHAGWRGTAAQIVIRTMEQMQARFGTEAADLRVAIGPGIGGCCYEVGVEVARQFGLEQAGTNRSGRNQPPAVGGIWRGRGARSRCLGGCTQCDAQLFHSFRRDQERAGRMVSWIEIAVNESACSRAVL